MDKGGRRLILVSGYSPPLSFRTIERNLIRYARRCINGGYHGIIALLSELEFIELKN